MSKNRDKSKVRGPDGKLYEVGEGEVYESPEDKKKKKPAKPGKLTPDPHSADISPDPRGANISPEGDDDTTPRSYGKIERDT